MNQRRGKPDDKAIQRVMEMAALKAKVSHATAQTQAIINTLVKYSEALGRLLQTSHTVVDTFDEVVKKHGPCPDEGLASQVAELRKVVYDHLPKNKETGDVEEPEVAGKGEQERDPDGGLDAPPTGEEPEGDAPPGGAETPEAPAPEETAPPQESG